jgi:sarcosine oxidase
VVGFEAYGPAHDLGSSHGESRIIRQAYWEDLCYVPLLLDSYRLWRELEALSGESLVRITGGMMIGRPEGDVVAGTLASARHWDLPHRILTAAEVHAEFPAFDLAPDEVAVLEPEAGVLAPELAILTHLRQAARLGANLHFGEAALGWEPSDGKVMVRTAVDTYKVDRLVLSAGAWSSELLNGWDLPLEVERQFMVWFSPPKVDIFSPSRFPIYLIEEPNGDVFYGFPAMDGRTVKAAQHHGGEMTTPAGLRREAGKPEVLSLRRHLARTIPSLSTAEIVRTKVCMYTDTPDLHFVIGLHPECAQVAVACGFSGHGFKFSSVVGEILADLAESGGTAHPIGRFSPERFRDRVYSN